MEPTALTEQPAPPPPPPELRAPAGTRLGVLLGVLLVISAALAGAVVLAGTHDQPHPVPAAEPIGGTLALRPDLVREARWPFRHNGGFAHPELGDADVGGPPLDYERIANPSAGSSGTALSLVEEFYRRAASDPAGATELLSTELLAGHRERLGAAWSSARAVRLLRARVEPDGAVAAEVEVAYPGGDRVRMRQLLRVATGAVPRIVGAELRAAEHLPAR